MQLSADFKLSADWADAPFADTLHGPPWGKHWLYALVLCSAVGLGDGEDEKGSGNALLQAAM
jgi:hypothetical protein